MFVQYPALSDAETGEVRQLYKIGKILFGLGDKRVTVVIDKTGTVRFDARIRIFRWLSH